MQTAAQRAARRLAPALLLGLAAALLAGCNLGKSSPGLPMDASLSFSAAALDDRDHIPLTLRFTARHDVARAELQLQTSGAVSIKGETEQTWQGLPEGQEVTVPVVVQAAGLGEGEVRAVINVRNDAGQTLYGVAPAVDFLVTVEEVLAGHSGVLELRLAYLDHLLAWGKVTPIEYQQEKKRILGGGATTTIIIEDESDGTGN